MCAEYGTPAAEARRRYSRRPRYDTAYDPAAGYAGGGFTKGRPPLRVGPICQCTLVIVPEELERQWANELRSPPPRRRRPTQGPRAVRLKL
jgi:hypothetical protein